MGYSYMSKAGVTQLAILSDNHSWLIVAIISYISFTIQPLTGAVVLAGQPAS